LGLASSYQKSRSAFAQIFYDSIVSKVTLFAGRAKGPYRATFRIAVDRILGFKSCTLNGDALYESGTMATIAVMKALSCLFPKGDAAANDAKSREDTTENFMMIRVKQ
jgi:hypothetical protein